MSPQISDNVRLARAVPAEQLAESLTPALVIKDRIFTFRLVLASELKRDERNTLWDIEDKNMKKMCLQSSMGWSPDAKKRELFHKLTRFILAYADRTELVGFTTFRFDHEDDRDELYCYEVQISDGMRGHGLGAALLSQLKAIGTAQSMEFIVLTALKANLGAMRFYKAHGFETDSTSPDESSCDYEILSIQLDKQVKTSGSTER